MKSVTVSPSICREVKGKEKVGQVGRGAGVHDRKTGSWWVAAV